MAVRRLHPDQPPHFGFTPENLAWAQAQIAKFPPGKQASAIIPLLWRAQEQAGWLSEPAIRAVCDMLGMAHIRGLEIATFYTMFQLAPVGRLAHVQVCGTTPCMLRGAGALIDVCKNRIHEAPHHLSDDGTFSWEEVECLGSCANAPMIQIGKDTFEDLTAADMEGLLDAFAASRDVTPGSQSGRKASCPAGGPTSLTDATLYDGSTVGQWRKRFTETAGEGVAAGAVSAANAAPQTPPAATAAPAVNTGALAAMANAGLVKDLESRSSGKALSADELERMKATSVTRAPMAAASGAGETASISSDAVGKPVLLTAPRDGKGDDLGLIWGVADKLAERLNAMGIWHFDQIAGWTAANIAWFENEMTGFKGRVARDKWIEQCQKLATGWRPDSDVGERPKG
ncbi:MAG: NADH-quinone oxidoreductase subunit NuoE [Hyphomicrobium sp.]